MFYQMCHLHVSTSYVTFLLIVTVHVAIKMNTVGVLKVFNLSAVSGKSFISMDVMLVAVFSVACQLFPV